MSTTTIRLSEELKDRIARAAKRAGTTSHAFILDAIEAKVDEEECRNNFFEIAEQRYAEIVVSGKTIPWNEMQTYLKNRYEVKREAGASVRAHWQCAPLPNSSCVLARMSAGDLA